MSENYEKYIKLRCEDFIPLFIGFRDYSRRTKGLEFAVDQKDIEMRKGVLALYNISVGAAVALGLEYLL